MLMRQLGATPQEKAANIQESVSVAKQAVALDLSDSESWCTCSPRRRPPPPARSRSTSTTNLHLLTKRHVTMTTDVLGNAYLAVFFATKHATSDLEAAMKAYKQAVRESVCPWGGSTPISLTLNCGVCCHCRTRTAPARTLTCTLTVATCTSTWRTMMRLRLPSALRWLWTHRCLPRMRWTASRSMCSALQTW